MKVLLNGATGGTNFGDFLFADIFQKHVGDIVGAENIYWYESRYQMSGFFKKHLGYTSKRYSLKDIDALVCISGGYFCGNDNSIWDYYVRYWRYFRICLKCIRKKIPIAIIGLDVAQSKNALIDRIQKYILKNAEIVTVRNKESIQQLEKYGIFTGIGTADTAHTIIATHQLSSEANIKTVSDRKSLFFHVQMSDIDQATRMIPVLNRFLLVHKEYDVYIGTDQYCANVDILNTIAGKIHAHQVTVLHYDYPLELCKTLSNMDLIITPKLHVGIVGATFSKSVVSFSVHTSKIKRFYQQMAAEERSLAMCDFTEDKALDMLEKFHNLPLYVTEDILKASYDNLEYLTAFLQNIKIEKEAIDED